jgi:hypothetical protein
LKNECEIESCCFRWAATRICGLRCTPSTLCGS